MPATILLCPPVHSVKFRQSPCFFRFFPTFYFFFFFISVTKLTLTVSSISRIYTLIIQRRSAGVDYTSEKERFDILQCGEFKSAGGRKMEKVGSPSRNFSILPGLFPFIFFFCCGANISEISPNAVRKYVRSRDRHSFPRVLSASRVFVFIYPTTYRNFYNSFVVVFFTV